MLDGSTQWHAQDLGAPLPHVREFLAETEHRFLTETKDQVADADAAPRPSGEVQLRSTSVTADSPGTSRPTSAGYDDRAAAGTVGIDPGRRGSRVAGI